MFGDGEALVTVKLRVAPARPWGLEAEA